MKVAKTNLKVRKWILSLGQVSGTNNALAVGQDMYQAPKGRNFLSEYPMFLSSSVALDTGMGYAKTMTSRVGSLTRYRKKVRWNQFWR